MSTADADDVPDPLAGIDLKAWQPPAPPIGQVDAILARVKDGTRVDGAAAVELEPEPETVRDRPRRTRWVAIGIIVGAAAAALLMIALWPRGDEPVTPVVPRPILIVTPGSGSGSASHPAGTVTTVDECKAFIAREDDAGLRDCSDRLPPAEALQVLQLDIKANEIKMAYAMLELAVANHDLATAEARLAEIPDDSSYHQRAVDLVDGIRPVVQRPTHAHTPPPSTDCDSVALLDKARDAGGNAQYSKMYAFARASNACNPNKKARQLALLAACRLGNTDAALELWPEFETNSGMLQVCAGVVDKPAQSSVSSGGCDANALLDEARTAGAADQWSKVLSKAEAANKCQPSKPARQMALLAACSLGNRDKALRYWKEFENNTGMQQRCIGVIK